MKLLNRNKYNVTNTNNITKKTNSTLTKNIIRRSINCLNKKTTKKYHLHCKSSKYSLDKMALEELKNQETTKTPVSKIATAKTPNSLLAKTKSAASSQFSSIKANLLSRFTSNNQPVTPVQNVKARATALNSVTRSIKATSTLNTAKPTFATPTTSTLTKQANLRTPSTVHTFRTNPQLQQQASRRLANSAVKQTVKSNIPSTPVNSRTANANIKKNISRTVDCAKTAIRRSIRLLNSPPGLSLTPDNPHRRNLFPSGTKIPVLKSVAHRDLSKTEGNQQRTVHLTKTEQPKSLKRRSLLTRKSRLSTDLEDGYLLITPKIMRQLIDSASKARSARKEIASEVLAEQDEEMEIKIKSIKPSSLLKMLLKDKHEEVNELEPVIENKTESNDDEIKMETEEVVQIKQNTDEKQIENEPIVSEQINEPKEIVPEPTPVENVQMETENTIETNSEVPKILNETREIETPAIVECQELISMPVIEAMECAAEINTENQVKINEPMAITSIETISTTEKTNVIEEMNINDVDDHLLKEEKNEAFDQEATTAIQETNQIDAKLAEPIEIIQEVQNIDALETNTEVHPESNPEPIVSPIQHYELVQEIKEDNNNDERIINNQTEEHAPIVNVESMETHIEESIEIQQVENVQTEESNTEKVEESIPINEAETVETNVSIEIQQTEIEPIKEVENDQPEEQEKVETIESIKTIEAVIEVEEKIETETPIVETEVKENENIEETTTAPVAEIENEIPITPAQNKKTRSARLNSVTRSASNVTKPTFNTPTMPRVARQASLKTPSTVHTFRLDTRRNKLTNVESTPVNKKIETNQPVENQQTDTEKVEESIPINEAEIVETNANIEIEQIKEVEESAPISNVDSVETNEIQQTEIEPIKEVENVQPEEQEKVETIEPIKTIEAVIEVEEKIETETPIVETEIEENKTTAACVETQSNLTLETAEIEKDIAKVNQLPVLNEQIEENVQVVENKQQNDQIDSNIPVENAVEQEQPPVEEKKPKGRGRPKRKQPLDEIQNENEHKEETVVEKIEEVAEVKEVKRRKYTRKNQKEQIQAVEIEQPAQAEKMEVEEAKVEPEKKVIEEAVATKPKRVYKRKAAAPLPEEPEPKVQNENNQPERVLTRAQRARLNKA